MIDTQEHRIYISDQATWGFLFDNDRFDTGVAVAGNAWTHVMALGGTSDLEGGGSAFGGAMFVNGTAVSAPQFFYDPSTTEFSVGGGQEGGNFYTGVMDDLSVFVWGDNSDAEPGIEGQLGTDYGPFNLLTDNDWVVAELQSRGIFGTPDILDVNLDGSVDFSSPTSADVAAFVTGWRGGDNLVDGIPVGDFGTRQVGDVNLDGSVDLADWAALNLASNGLAGSMIATAPNTSTVPEPTAAAMLAAIAVLFVGIGHRRLTT